MTRLDRYLQGLEPVRLRDWLLAVAFPVIGLITEAVVDWDTDTGWFGLGAGLIVRLTTRPVRVRVSPVASIEER